jgi:replicative DNA helicase
MPLPDHAGPADRRSPGRIPPHNLEAEESLLGAMLLSKEAIATAVETVAADDFYRPAHAHLFEAIVTLYGAGEPVDPLTVADGLRRHDLLDRLGGKPAILRIQAATPAASNAGVYARIVADRALLRRLVAVGSQIAELGYTLPDDITAVLDEAETLVFAVANRRQTTSLRGLHATLQESLDRLEALFDHGGGATGVPTGFADLDDVVLGWQPSNLIVVAARPGQGKTAFALGTAVHAAVHGGRPVVFFSMEMGHLELTQRVLAAEAGVDSRALRTGRIPESAWSKISGAIGRLGEAPLFIDDNPHLTVMDMRAKCRRLKAQHGDLGLVVVDYLQLMSTGRRAENRQVEVAELARGLKVLARDLDVPVVALSQLNRALEYRADKRPMLADLRESGALEQDADIVLFIYRDETYNPDSSEKGLAEVIVAKHRNGPTAKIRLAFVEHLTRFADVSGRDGGRVGG